MNNIEDLEQGILTLEKRADALKEKALKDDLSIGKKCWEDILVVTQDDYNWFKFRIHSKPLWCLDLAKDWCAYVEVIKELSSLDNQISVSSGKNDETLMKEYAEVHSKRVQLEKILQFAMYGKEYINRWAEWHKNNQVENKDQSLNKNFTGAGKLLFKTVGGTTKMPE
jgi:hypothetical protein